MQVAGILQTVEESTEWFRSVESCSPPSDGVQPDVVFMDIHLADGLAFRIFDQVKVPYPIIFTTAYDQYALQAFQVFQGALATVDVPRESKTCHSTFLLMIIINGFYRCCQNISFKDHTLPLP